MREIKLTREEKMIEDALIKGELKRASPEKFREVAEAIANYKARQKNAVLNIRINAGDLQLLKDKAKKMGVKYQTFISEILHRIAHT
mgnify:CR=1 FL=1